MKITILQRNIEWANPAVNVQRADEAIRMTTPVITAFTKKKILENLSHGEEDEL